MIFKIFLWLQSLSLKNFLGNAICCWQQPVLRIHYPVTYPTHWDHFPKWTGSSQNGCWHDKEGDPVWKEWIEWIKLIQVIEWIAPCLLRFDYVIKNDHLRGSSLLAMMRLRHRKWPLERPFPVCYAAITSSKLITWDAIPCLLCCDYVIPSDHLRNNSLPAMLRLRHAFPGGGLVELWFGRRCRQAPRSLPCA